MNLFSKVIQWCICFAAVEIIADTIYNSTFSDSDVDYERANVLKELEVSIEQNFSCCVSSLIL